MNKTISINIGGFVFNIEEEAYQKLYQYLSAIKSNFKASEDCEEIMDDIEQRIAEILKSRNIQKEVVVDKDIDYVIETMGRPEDYMSEGFEQTVQDNVTSTVVQDQHIGPKRLFRDTENAILGGVCSGLSQYFNIDVSFIRIALVLFTIFFGTGVFLYIVLFFVVPEAKTTADKLQMKGHPVTVETIKGHFVKLKRDISENTRNGKLNRLFSEGLYKGVSFITILVKIISVVIAFALLVGGLFVLPIVFTVFFGNNGLIPLTDSEHAIGLFTIIDMVSPLPGFSIFIFLSVVFVIMIPIIGMIMTGAKVLFKIKASFKTVGIIMGALWVLSFGYTIISGINLGMNFRSHTAVEYDIPVSDTTQALYIEVAEDNIFSSKLSYEDVWNHSEFIKVDKDKVLLGYPKLNIVEKDDSSGIEVVLYKKSNGLTTRDAVDKAERIDYKVNFEGNKMTLAPYFTIPKSDKFRSQLAVVEVRVPKGKKVRLGNRVDRINLSVDGGHQYGERSFSKTTWTVGKKHLECLECKQLHH